MTDPLVAPGRRPRALPAAPAAGAGRLLCAALACWVCAAARAEVSCPDQLAVQQRAEAPSGWSASYSNVPTRLVGVTLFDGPPSNRVSLKPDRRRQTAKELVLMWNLRASRRNHYLQCSYDRTTAMLSVALPPGVQRCEVAYDRNAALPGGGLAVRRMVCR